MIELKIFSNLLKYSESEDKVLVDDKETKDWAPVFIPNGADEPSFFGFLNKSTKKCHSIYGTECKIVDENSIKL